MGTSATVIVIGAGPAALAAANHLGTVPGLDVVVVSPGGSSDFLAGTLPVATGDAEVSDYRVPVAIDGVRVIDARAGAIRPATGTSGPAVLINGDWLEAQSVIAAPGLAVAEIGAAPNLYGFWGLDGASEARSSVTSFDGGTLTVAIASGVYRCPPAPYGLAMRLAERVRSLGLTAQVRLTTPEDRPLAAIGTSVSDYLRRACDEAGIEVRYGFALNPDALNEGVLADVSGEVLDTDLGLVVPPHYKNLLLQDAASTGPLVEVDEFGRTSIDGVFAAGDAVARPFPRASAPADVSGLIAARGVLHTLGLADEPLEILPEPDCFVDRGSGQYSRIQITYPDGVPPSAEPYVTISDPRHETHAAFTEARRTWMSMCGS
ncbi:MAG: hypothetical protein KDB26_03845 [Microthrixaceae bacterium]|nr:hypothetical protein [Microthrixaceae bacterium]